MAELADALDLGSSVLDVQVQLLLPAPLANLFELFQKVEFVVDQSLKDWSFFVYNPSKKSY